MTAPSRQAHWRSVLQDRRRQRESAGLQRRTRTCADPAGVRRRVDGRELLCFGSNDYLGLANDPRIARALAHGAAQWGVGAGAAHLLGGQTRAHRELEDELADWLGYPRALLFSTGYMANLGAVAALATGAQALVQDRLNHASLIDASRLVELPLKRYPHGDAAAAIRRLSSHPKSLLCTDGVFSMDGDMAPLAELAAACQDHDALLLVDDAHGIGATGPAGRGSVAACQLGHGDVPVLVGTLGKAVGCFGAFVLGDDGLIDQLINEARSHVFTTALPPAFACAARAAVQIARDDDEGRDRLAARIAQFRAGAASLGLELLPSGTPIQPLMVGGANEAIRVSAALEGEGIWVPAIRPPTVPAGRARLRVTLSAAHGAEEVDRLLDALDRVQIQ